MQITYDKAHSKGQMSTRIRNAGLKIRDSLEQIKLISEAKSRTQELVLCVQESPADEI